MVKTNEEIKSPEIIVSQVEKMLANPIFSSNKTNPQYADFLLHTKEELRKLLACLSDVKDQQREQVTKWLNQQHTTKRLSNIDNAIHHLEKAETQQVKPLVIKDSVRNVNHGVQYSPALTEYLNLDDLIKRRQDFQNKLHKAQQAKDVISSSADIAGSLKKAVDTGKAAVSATSHTAESASTIAHTGQALGAVSPVLQTIPIIGGIVNAVTATGDAIYSFAKKKGASDIVAKVITAAVAVAAVALTIAFPVAALAIAAGTNAVTTITNYIKPYFDLGNEIKAKEIELENSKQRPAELDKPGTQLIDGEKDFLIHHLNDHFAKNDKISLETLQIAKEAVKSGDLAALEKNQQVRDALGLNETQSVKEKLLEHHSDIHTNMASQIARLKTEKTTKGALAIANTAATVGLAMMAVPFPPVIFAGAIVAAVCTIAQFAIQYREKIGNFTKNIGQGIKNIFFPDKSKDIKLEHKLTNKNDNVNTVIVSKAPEKKARRDKTHDKSRAEEASRRFAIAAGEHNESLDHSHTHRGLRRR